MQRNLSINMSSKLSKCNECAAKTYLWQMNVGVSCWVRPALSNIVNLDAAQRKKKTKERTHLYAYEYFSVFLYIYIRIQKVKYK